MISLIALLIGTQGAFGSSPSAPFFTGYTPSAVSPAGPVNTLQLHAAGHRFHEMGRLRAKALRIQAADGGRLTPEHRAQLQAQLEALDRHLAIGER